jgi:hypothetical protein
METAEPSDVVVAADPPGLLCRGPSSDGEDVGCWGTASGADDQLEYDFPEMRAPASAGTRSISTPRGTRRRPEQAKLLFGGPEAPLDVRPGAPILWAALLFASVFRQWSYTVLSQLYALSPDVSFLPASAPSEKEKKRDRRARRTTATT